MTESIKLGVAGLGTVGTGLLELLASRREHLVEMTGRPIDVVAVSARTRDRDRGISLEGVAWHDDAVVLAKDPNIDVFVELIGGDEGVAKASVEAALDAGKHVVTANKALLAKHGIALAKRAEKNAVALNYEAAVAGGIPIVKTLREAVAANKINRVYGILNGTCNYILSRMQDEHLAFKDVLKDAQNKGYAEADPTFDIGGFDAAHKLAILTTLAFGSEVAFDEVHVEGIEAIASADIEAAADLGYRIKLLGVALKTESGIEARVHPAMVPFHGAVAEVSGVTNCVAIDGDTIGNLLLVGPGAGSAPTASAVASDIVDIARGHILAPFVRSAKALKPFKRADLGTHQGAYYVRLSVFDRPGAMAGIAKCMGDEGVSLESIVQRQSAVEKAGPATGRISGDAATVVLITHETTEEKIRSALAAIEQDGKVAETPQMIRIEAL
ncbi:MAG: homoserine dehydrogenase [Alphaproteobacteria bacterium]|nr:homoserine dehydrogenase [Alphaproteobacteria bacterium]